MFYIIASVDGVVVARDRLVAACQQRGIAYEVADPLRFDPRKRSFSKQDSYYRVSLHKRARLLDIYLTRMECRSVSMAGFIKLDTMEGDIICTGHGIHCIPTVYFPVLEPTMLAQQVASLGGFPVIVKEMGSSSGGGIMKADSMSSLLSILRTVIADAHGNVFLKKYIEHDEQARIVVLDGQVIGEKGNLKRGDEIVLNSGLDFVQEKRNYSADIRAIALSATKALGLHFAGVDILLGKDGKDYLAEVNTPCAFTYVEDVAGVDIAGKIVDFLN